MALILFRILKKILTANGKFIKCIFGGLINNFIVIGSNGEKGPSFFSMDNLIN